MPAELFDTHCHLAASALLPQAERILSDARAAGVTRILNIACQPDEFAPALSLASNSPPLAPPYKGGGRGGEFELAHGEGGPTAPTNPPPRPALWVATGIHPHEAARVSDADWATLTATWRQLKVVAAGEMGLDYHYDFSPRDVQRAVFERQLDLAAQADLPIIIHCREAQPDAVEILLRHGFEHRPVVFHCFSGTPEEAAELRFHGWWTSFTGVITFKNAAPQCQACLETPLDQLMFETDSPYLSPEPVRRMRPNEPQNLLHTVRFAAQLRGEPFESFAAQTTANAQRFFRI